MATRLPLPSTRRSWLATAKPGGFTWQARARPWFWITIKAPFLFDLPPWTLFIRKITATSIVSIPFIANGRIWGTERRVTFANLAPGQYSLVVKGANAHGTWNEAGNSLAIRIVPPFYWSPAAKLGYGIIFILGIIGAALFYRSRLRRQATDLVLRKTQRQQREKMEALGRLAGGVAHEFNNMLASVLGFSYLAKAELGRKSTSYQYLQEIETASLHAKDMVNRILTFSRKSRPRYQPLEVQKVVAEALTLARVTLSPEVQVVEDFQAGDTWIWGDATQLSQVIINLCTNADQAMDRPPRILKVGLRKVKAEEPGNAETLLLQVEDTGSGMSETVRRQIFDPYFTTKKPGQGTGLGLSLVHGIIMEMKGSISVASQPRKGSRFDLRFPLLEKRGAVETSPRNLTQLGKGQRVLWIDDDARILKVGCTMLNQMGFAAEALKNPKAIDNALGKDKPAVVLVICDWVMPQWSGNNW